VGVAGTADAGLDLCDEDALARARNGDGASYELLMRRYNQRVYRAVRAILRDESDIEDVMQETYLAAFRHLDGFAGRARFSSWLVRIAVNRALDRRRRAARSLSLDPLREDSAPAEASLARDPEQELGARELVGLLEAAIETLPENFRAAYVLRELEGMDLADAARCLGVEAATVKTRVHRARRLLREALGREIEPIAAEIFRFGGERCDRVVAAVLAHGL
jgi:RNA polymerase sigma-70 factor (ECF subfamily)